MPGIIQKYAKNPLVIRQAPVIVDGKASYQNEIPATGMIFDFSQRDIDYFGSIQNGKIFLVAPLAETPSLPGQIVHDGISYEIKGVKTYRNLKGRLLGYRIAVMGA